MANSVKVNPQVVDALQVTKDFTMSPDVVQTAGAGKAYQSVAQSTAIAVQDAADYLRNVNTIGTTAMGVAMAQLLATKDTFYSQVLEQARQLTSEAATNFNSIGSSAASVLKEFPSGQESAQQESGNNTAT